MRRVSVVRAVLAWSLALAAGVVLAAQGTESTLEQVRPIVIAHRGASGYVPEHTLAAYFIAAQQGADFLEPDLVMTRDGVLVARHENEISATTDVASRAEFAARRATRVIDGQSVTGWFTEDFTLAELKTLRARERIPQLRPGNVRFDGMFEIPTLEEILALVQGLDAQRQAAARAAGVAPPPPLGLYPETKHPTYFAARGLPMEKALVDTLQRWGYVGRDAPIFIQSFETGNLKALRGMTQLPLIQLLAADGRPWDWEVAGDARTYRDLATPEGLHTIARYADGIGPEKTMIVGRDGMGAMGSPSALVQDAHAAGLRVHPWTFRAENHFLPGPQRSAGSPADRGDLGGELQPFLVNGIDGFFTDHPDLGVRARDAYVRTR